MGDDKENTTAGQSGVQRVDGGPDSSMQIKKGVIQPEKLPSLLKKKDEKSPSPTVDRSTTPPGPGDFIKGDVLKRPGVAMPVTGSGSRSGS